MHLPSLLFLSQMWLAFCVECEPEEKCSSCFSELLHQATHNGQNLLHLQNLFFPPEGSLPSLVTIFYHYEEENGTGLSNETEVWFWATSSFYFYHPPHVFTFTSLFFSDTHLHSHQLHLNLSYDCYNASSNFMMAVTEKLKVSAASATTPNLSPRISSAVAVSRSLGTLHTQHSYRNTYLFVYFIVFPILTHLLILFSAVYFVDQKLNNLLTEGLGEKAKYHRLALQNKAILSLVAVLYILTVSVISVYQTTNTSKYVSQEVSQYFSLLPLEGNVLQAISSISAMSFVLDAIVSVLALICLLIMTWGRNIWKFCAYSILFPTCCVANHVNYIFIACIQNTHHVIIAAAVYSLACIFMSAMLTHISYLVDHRIRNKSRHPMVIQLIVKMAFTIFLCGYIGCGSLFYLFLPTRQSLHFPTQFYIVIMVAIFAIAFFFSTKKPQHSLLWIFAEAETERRSSSPHDAWHRKTTREQEVAIAKAILRKVLPPVSDKNCQETSATLQQDDGNQCGDEREGHPSSGTSFVLHEIPASNQNELKLETQN